MDDSIPDCGSSHGSYDSSDQAGVKMARPPDKKKHEAHLEQLNEGIDVRQNEMRTLASRSDEANQSLRNMRAEREGAIQKRRDIDGRLSALSADIQKKNAEKTKAQTNLRYRSEARINEAITKLEHQLKVTNFKLIEEKKIVAEIGSLKRSKKAVGVVNSFNAEIDVMRQDQARLRKERDAAFKREQDIRKQEEALKQRNSQDKIRQETIRKELDTLFEEKRQTIAQFKAHEKEFLRFRDQLRQKKKQDFRRKKEEEQLAYKQRVADYKASREPYEREKQLCSALIAYLTKLVPADSSTPLDGATTGVSSATSGSAGTVAGGEEDSCSSSHDSDSLAQSFEAEGLFLLRKKPEDLFRGVVKPARRSKKDKKRMSMHKPLQHTPLVLNQFAELELQAPPTAVEVAEALQLVDSKRLHYEALAASKPVNRTQTTEAGDSTTSTTPLYLDAAMEAGAGSGWDGGGSSGGAPSVTESAIAESIPSTPEVQLDCGESTAHPLRGADGGSDVCTSASGFSTYRGERKLSLDSGACELEDGESDEQKAPDMTSFPGQLSGGAQHLIEGSWGAVGQSSLDNSMVYKGFGYMKLNSEGPPSQSSKLFMNWTEQNQMQFQTNPVLENPSLMDQERQILNNDANLFNPLVGVVGNVGDNTEHSLTLFQRHRSNQSDVDSSTTSSSDTVVDWLSGTNVTAEDSKPSVTFTSPNTTTESSIEGACFTDQVDSEWPALSSTRIRAFSAPIKSISVPTRDHSDFLAPAEPLVTTTNVSVPSKGDTFADSCIRLL